MKNPFLFISTLALSFVAAFVTSAATINVSTSSALASALTTVNPGDEIVLANGSYSGFTATRDGTAAAPITIRAANQGQATVNSGLIRLSNTSYVILQGLNITTSGSSQTVDGETYRAAVWFEVADHCRITRCTLNLAGQPSATQWVLLSGNSRSNRVDHCDFGPNTVHGSHMVWPRGRRDIPGVTPPSDRTQWALGNGPVNPNMVLYTQIDHNYFHGQASGSAETIVTGAIGSTGDYQNTFTLIEFNLFQDCDGDPEIVSVKSSSNTVRYNTVRSSSGVFSLRSGNSGLIYGNFFLCGGSGGGVKVNERNHTIYNNYVENSDASQYPIMLEDGDPYNSDTFAHAQVVNCRVIHNTIVNPGRPFQVGHGSGTLHPQDCVMANNIIKGTGSLYSQDNPINMTRSQNIISADPGQSGFIVADPQFTTVNGLQKLSSGSPAVDAANQSFYSLVTDDMDGQTRGTRDIGADEVSGATILRAPLTTADVGPNSPPDGTDFTLTATPSTRSINAGSSTTYTATIAAVNGFSGTVTLAASGLPSGASASFSPATITGSGSSTMTVTTSGATPAGTSSLTITGTSGSLVHSTAVSLTVTVPAPDFSISATPSSRTVSAGAGTTYTATVGAINGFGGNVALSVSGLPAGVSGSFSPTSVAGSGTSTLTVTTTTGTSAGNYTLTITGTSGALTHSTTVTLAVTGAAGCMTLSSTGIWTNTAMATQTGTFTATFDTTPSVDLLSAAVGLSQGSQTAFSGFGCAVIFATSGVIQARNGGAYAADNTIPFSGGVTYHFRLVVNVAAHTYSIFVTPAGGSETTVGSNYAFRTEQNTVTSLNSWGALVNTSPAGTMNVCGFAVSGPAADFSLAATPSTRTVTAGGGTTYTATVGALNGFSGSVALSVSGLPAGATASFSPTSINTSGSSTLTVTTSGSTPPATSTLTITGTSGALTHTAPVSLTVSSVSCLSVSSTGIWTNTAMATQTGTFTASFDTTPSVNLLSAAVGLSQGSQTTFSGFGCAVIFATSGVIQARNGGAYAADNTIPFSGGVTYHFRLVVNVAAHTYSIFVTPAGGSEITVGSNYAFRTEQNTVTSLNSWGALVNTSPAGNMSVCGFTLQ